MPVVTVREAEATPATVNTPGLTREAAERLRVHFGADRLREVLPVMGGEDFSRFLIANPEMESFIFWVGGVPQARWDAAGGDPAQLPSLHSAFWAPEAETVIATATEAMTVAALGVLGRR
jgi:metal-dependent amidase/aminoacylase/carboxypeptidase family protein